MRYRVFLLEDSPIEFHAFDFRVWGARRIKCYMNKEDSYPCSERSIDIFLPSDITQICDDHGHKVYIK